ncbi:MAG: LysR family transcriptional regulator [Clostridiaceae bacterium]
MKLRHLKIFITVADLGSMTAASEVLFIAQPTVSQAISELESHYGVKLFDRLSKRLYITEAGKQLLNYARHITALFDDMDRTMKTPDGKGIIKIGSSVTVGTYLMPKIVKEFSNIYPLLQVYAVTKNTKDIESLIIKNHIDFGVVEGRVHTTDIISTPFMDDELVLVCGKSYPLYKVKSIDPFELSHHNFIVREQGSATRELFESIMTVNDIKWNPVWESMSSDSIKNAAINGIGIAVISKQLVLSELKKEELYVIDVEGLDFKRKFSVIYHKNKYLTESMKIFFDLCYAFQNKVN